MMRLASLLGAAVAGAATFLIARTIGGGPPAPPAGAPSSRLPGLRFVQARTFKRGTPGRRVDHIVLHTTEPPKGDPLALGVALSTANYFATLPAGKVASAHLVVGPEEAVQCVELDDVAWHAPPANEHGIGVEFTARTARAPGGDPAFTPETWAEPRAEAMLERGAELVATIAAERGVPATFVDAAGLLRGERGITTHREIARAWRKTDHQDPGDAFPLQHFLELVQSRGAVA